MDSATTMQSQELSSYIALLDFGRRARSPDRASGSADATAATFAAQMSQPVSAVHSSSNFHRNRSRPQRRFNFLRLVKLAIQPRDTPTRFPQRERPDHMPPNLREN